MAGVLRASSVLPAYVSPHRKRRRQMQHVTQCVPRAYAIFPARTYSIDRKLEVEYFRDAVSIRIRNVGWRFKMRGCTVFDAASSVGLYKTRLVQSALPGTDLALHATVTDMSMTQSSSLELAPIESVSMSAPSLGECMLTSRNFLVNMVLDPYIQVSTFILVFYLLANLFENGDSRERCTDDNMDKSVEIVSRPSPFNRFVINRCPSISSPSTPLSFGRKEQIRGQENGVVYQRKCLHAADGGVVAIDWPSQLDFAGEDGFDNTLLLVPGTTEGSRDDGVEKFVMDAMRFGYFPVVLNPRGCAASPLTTPRVFTAADSDDVHLVIQYIISAQPRSTLMGVGWGFGANMLAKYLGKEGGGASLMAAVCISNPFDLQETSNHLSRKSGGKFDRAMAKGLVNILKANQMLFAGERKGYDVSKALAAKSVCEFESAISRVSYGFETLEEFHAAASSSKNISTVQIPLLFIQGEDDAIPVTIPRQALEANPFTTALVAQPTTRTSSSNDRIVKEPGSASRHDWSHSVALEWLAAVEVGLLKGRHPCLDIVSLGSRVDETFPNRDSTEEEKRVSSNHKGKFLQVVSEQSKEDGRQDYGKEVVSGSKNDHGTLRQEDSGLGVDSAENGNASKSGDSETVLVGEDEESANPEEQNGAPEEQATPPEEGKPEGEPEEGSEAFQMRMAAESIMKVLDITMPGTLSDEKKTEVLTAVGKGETILTALQEAVPEDVRGSMAAAVSGAVQARGLSFNLVGFGKNMPPPSLPAGLISSIKGKLEGVSVGKKEAAAISETPTTDSGEPEKQNQEPHKSGNVSNDSGEQRKDSGDNGKLKTEDRKSKDHEPSDPQIGKATPVGGANNEGHAHPETSDKKLENIDDNGAKAKASERHKDDESENTKTDVGKDENVSKQVDEKDNSGKEKVSSEGVDDSSSNHKEDVAKNPKGELNENTKEFAERQEKTEQKGVENKGEGGDAPVDQGGQKEDKQPEKSLDSSEGVAKEETKPEGDSLPSSGNSDPGIATSAPGPAPVPTSPPVSTPSSPKTGMAPPIDMRLAFQALTGFDDSTQMAVTNVFGVVESMLEQMEKDQGAIGSGPSDASKESTDAHQNEKDEGELVGEKEQLEKEQKSTESAAPDTSEEATDDHEKKSDVGSNGENSDQAERETASSEHNGEDRGARTAENGHTNLVTVDDANISPVNIADKSIHTNGLAVKVADNEQGAIKNMENTSNKSLKPHVPPSYSSSRCYDNSAQRPSSRVMVIHRVGNSMFVKSLFNHEAPELIKSLDTELNGAASESTATSRDVRDISKYVNSKGADPQTQQINGPMRDVNVTKPIPATTTMEQLLVEVDHESQQKQENRERVQGSQTIDVEATDIKEAKSPNMVESMVADALKLEVLRRLGVAGMESLGVDLEKEVANVADAVAEAVQNWKQKPSSNGSESGKLGILQSDYIVNTLGSVVSGTSILGGLVPIGVLAGVVLASLGAVYLIVTDHQESKERDDEVDHGSVEEEEVHSEHAIWPEAKESALDVPVLSVNQHDQEDLDNPADGSSKLWWDDEIPEGIDNSSDDHNAETKEAARLSTEQETEGEDNNKLMGMMAAAVSGGATLAGMSMSNNGTATENQVTDEGEKTGSKSENPSIVSSIHPLAEKALSVAAPVVPTTEDGEIDHERLVAMLAELGQRGGFFRLIGKVALLWGGLRGAMSLTDRLLVFLRVSERPLHLRLVGFAAMIVLLWSPVLVPVLPSLLQQWATKSPNAVANAASVVGLYGAILILITIWGKRVRGYNKPLLHYGLRLYSSRKLRDVVSGLALGCGSVIALYSTNAVLGYVRFDWNALLAPSPKLPGAAGVTIFTAMKVCRLLGQAVAIGLAVALVEEVLFRSWLQEEIAVDLGFHWAVFISALAFSIIHWSPAAMPGLWFLAVALAGARARTGRNLAFPIGLHAGLVAANFFFTVGGLVRYLAHAPAWFTGAHAGSPLAGALGTAMTALLAVILYPRTTITPPVVTLPIDSAEKVGT